MEARSSPISRAALPRYAPSGDNRDGGSGRVRCHAHGLVRSHVAADVGTLQPCAHGCEAHCTRQAGKRSDGWGFGRDSTRSGEGKLTGYVTIHVTITLPVFSVCLYPSEKNGGRDRTRTCDLL